MVGKIVRDTHSHSHRIQSACRANAERRQSHHSQRRQSETHPKRAARARANRAVAYRVRASREVSKSGSRQSERRQSETHTEREHRASADAATAHTSGVDTARADRATAEHGPHAEGSAR